MTATKLLDLIGWAFGLAYGLYVFYLSYVTLNAARLNGKLDMAPRPVKWIGWSIVSIGAVLDVSFNVTVGSVVYLELPELSRLFFTARCAKWKPDPGWRGDIARYVCDGWLNPFEAGHC